MATTKYVSKIKNGTEIINIKDAEARTSLSSKVDKVDGKGLSTNDFTTALKNKLDGIASGATANTGTVTKVSAGTGLSGGDITTTGTISLATSGVTAGTYKRVTVDAYGRVTAGDNTDNNTTYTFTGGTNKFTVTPSGGSAQDVTVTPSISNNVTANGNFAANAIIVGNAANQVAKNSGITISTAAPSSSSADTTVPTSKAVWSAIDALPEPMVFKGSLGTGGTITALPVNGTANIGDTYKVITAGTYASQAAKAGDVFICSAKTSSSNSWTYIPSADEPSGTVTSVKIAAGTGLSVDDANAITTSGTRTISLSSASQTSLGKADTAIQTITAAAGSNIGSVGTPSVTASTSNNATTLTFNYLKGAKGDKGDTGSNGSNGTNGTSAYWFSGTAVTGTATSGISAAVSGSKAGDMYLNTSTYNVYKATAANTWGYICNIKGATGSNGANGTNGTNGVSCTHSWSGTTLTVTSASGTSSANLKGDKGDTGTTPTIAAAAGSNIGTVGTPSVTASTSGTTTTFTFNYLKGAKGDPGQNATTTSVVSTSANGLAPKVTDTSKFLKGDGTWATPTNTDERVKVNNITSTSDSTYYIATANAINGTAQSLNGIDSFYLRGFAGTASKDGSAILYIGNATATGTAGNSKGGIRLFGNNTGYAQIVYTDSATSSTQTFPTTSGTILNSGTSSVSKSGETLTVKINGTEKSLTNTTYSNFVKSGSGAAAGLVPAPSTTAGTTKYLREDGTWQTPPDNNTWNAASSSQAGYVPAATKGKFLHSNASTGNLEWIDDNNTTYTPQKLGTGIGTCSTSSGTALTVSLTGYELVQNGIVAVTFANDVPANATLNINSKGAKPIYYKGSAIEADIIKADDTVMFAYNGSQYVVTSLGGSSVSPNEIVNISLTQTGGNSADLIGATITIKDDGGNTLFTATWQGSMITTEIDVNTNYTVSVGTVSGYIDCHSQSYQAGYQTTRYISFQYRALGVFIEATDGTIYTKNNWSSSGKTANSIITVTSEHTLRWSLTAPSLPLHKNSSDPLGNYVDRGWGTEDCKTDFAGDTHTNQIVSFNSAYGTNTTSYGAPYCKNYIWPDGHTGAHLPSGGDYWILIQNMNAFNQCASACGGTSYGGECFTSNYSSYNGTVWMIITQGDHFIGGEMRNSYPVRPVEEII